jgi:DNA-binding response OmpR family regulator
VVTPGSSSLDALQPRAAARRVLILSPATTGLGEELLECLERDEISYTVATAGEDSMGVLRPDAILFDLTQADRQAAETIPGEPRSSSMPTIAAVSADHLDAPQLRIPTGDVIVCPWPRGELALRVQRLLDAVTPPPAPGVVSNGDLVIDTNRYEVFLAGRPVLLTFKEYELLKVLGSNPGRVYSRETLLEQVWGYAYFGGTRTVDVHIRRLRSKIEDAQHTFIDTVWNVGYRFRG